MGAKRAPGGGRKKTPKAELVLRGSRHARYREHEPAVIVLHEVECPEWLTGDGRSYWNLHAPALVKIGVLSAPDLPACGMLCQRYADWRAWRKMLAERGSYIPVKNNAGEVIGARRAPWDMRERDLYAQYFMACREFGLTPASRGGIEAVENEPRDKIEDCIT